MRRYRYQPASEAQSPDDSCRPNALTVAEARRLQTEWAPRVKTVPLNRTVLTVAGADVAFSPDQSTAFGAVVLLRYPQLDLLEVATARLPLQFPYVPGLLSFREAPVIVAACRKLAAGPDLLMIDGQGLAHPRRFGLACHVGLELNLPTLGCAKSRLVGAAAEPGWQKGDQQPLHDGPEQIGTLLRTRDRVKCLYVSVGHLLRLDDAVEWVLRCCTRYRLPETTRRAHLEVSKLAR